MIFIISREVYTEKKKLKLTTTKMTKHRVFRARWQQNIRRACALLLLNCKAWSFTVAALASMLSNLSPLSRAKLKNRKKIDVNFYKK